MGPPVEEKNNGSGRRSRIERGGGKWHRGERSHFAGVKRQHSLLVVRSKCQKCVFQSLLFFTGKEPSND